MAKIGIKDYYKVLGVRENASVEEIKSAFRTLARQHHPDTRPGTKGDEARFKEMSEAYAVLTDPEKRAEYDSRLSARTRRDGRSDRTATKQYVYTGASGARSGTAGHPERSIRVEANFGKGLFGISLGLGAVDDLLAGLDRALSQADKVTQGRRCPPQPQSSKKRNSR